jgi:hypothetical protein
LVSVVSDDECLFRVEENWFLDFGFFLSALIRLSFGSIFFAILAAVSATTSSLTLVLATFPVTILISIVSRSVLSVIALLVVIFPAALSSPPSSLIIAVAASLFTRAASFGFAEAFVPNA